MYEMLVNIAYAMMLPFLKTRSLIAILLTAASGLVIAHYLRPSLNIGDYGLTWNSMPFAIFRVTYSFFAGVMVYRWFSSAGPAQSLRRSSDLVPWAMLTLVTLLLIARPGKHNQPFFDLLCVFVIFPSIILVALRFQPVGFGAWVCKFLGDISYPLYAIHAPLVGLLILVFPSHFAYHAPWSGLVFLLACWQPAGFWPAGMMLRPDGSCLHSGATHRPFPESSPDGPGLHRVNDRSSIPIARCDRSARPSATSLRAAAKSRLGE